MYNDEEKQEAHRKASAKYRKNNLEKVRKGSRESARRTGLGLKKYCSDPDKYRLAVRITNAVKWGIDKEAAREYLETRAVDVTVCDICQQECPTGKSLALDHNR